MTKRLTQDRFNEICDMELPKGKAVTAIAELLDEVVALRAELAGAEERGRKLADACRGLLSEMHVGDGKVVCPDAFMPHVRAIYELLRADLHRRTGTTPADGGESQ